MQRICAKILSIITDYTNSEVARPVVQVTVCTAQWLGRVRLIFKLFYYVYVYVIITLILQKLILNFISELF